MSKVTVKEWLDSATSKLKESGIPSPRLDCELILIDVIGKDKTWLISHSDHFIENSLCAEANSMLLKRLERCPIAYLTGKKEFYGREFATNPHVLIPRPESETIIDIIKDLADKPSRNIRIIDIGTGSGALGVTLKLEIPSSDVTLSGVSAEALTVAEQNAKSLGAKISLANSNLLDSFTDTRFDIIVANLPYVDKSWETSPETAFEPQPALYAEDGGLEIIKQLIVQSPAHMNHSGYLVLEADPLQHVNIVNFAKNYNFQPITQSGFGLALQYLPSVDAQA